MNVLGVPHEVPLHDVGERMHFMAFVMFMWESTRHLRGKPTIREAEITLARFPEVTREWIIDRLVTDGHVRR